ncbi:hypothetical protein B0H14DRAFT_2578989 [Mycena olivaceomarginata]|nr:hypothetical protein B0H14DRAFT_2578989 [Mycena olivaceomarginata]
MRGYGKCVREHRAWVWDVRSAGGGHGERTLRKGMCAWGKCAGVVWDVGAQGRARARTGRRGDVARAVAGVRFMGTVALGGRRRRGRSGGWALNAGARRRMDAGRDEQGNAMRKRVWGASGVRGTGVAAKGAVGGATVSAGRRGEVKGRRVRADVTWRGTAAATAAATSKAARGDCAVALGWRGGTNVATVKLPVVGPLRSLRRCMPKYGRFLCRALQADAAPNSSQALPQDRGKRQKPNRDVERLKPSRSPPNPRGREVAENTLEYARSSGRDWTGK